MFRIYRTNSDPMIIKRAHKHTHKHKEHYTHIKAQHIYTFTHTTTLYGLSRKITTLISNILMIRTQVHVKREILKVEVNKLKSVVIYQQLWSFLPF